MEAVSDTRGTVTLLAACVPGSGAWPAPGETRLPNEAGTAIARAAGVEVILRADAWNADPPNLEESVIPLNVTIENTGEHALRVRYPDLKLRSDVLDYQPLPAAKLVDKTVTVRTDPLLVPRPPSHRFRLAPNRFPDYPGLDHWTATWVDEPRLLRKAICQVDRRPADGRHD